HCRLARPRSCRSGGRGRSCSWGSRKPAAAGIPFQRFATRSARHAFGCFPSAVRRIRHLHYSREAGDSHRSYCCFEIGVIVRRGFPMRSIFRIALLEIVITSFLVWFAAAQTVLNPSAHWEGVIHMPDQDLAMTLDLARGSSGAWIGSLSFPK